MSDMNLTPHGSTMPCTPEQSTCCALKLLQPRLDLFTPTTPALADQTVQVMYAIQVTNIDLMLASPMHPHTCTHSLPHHLI